MEEYIINSCGISDCTPEWSWVTGENGFGDYDIWAAFRGRGKISVGGQEFDVSAGSCIVLPPHKKIMASHDPSDPLLIVHIHFSSSNKDDTPATLSGRHISVRDIVFFRDILDRVLICYYRNLAEKASMWLSAALSELDAATDITSDRGSGGKSRPMIYEMCDEINSSRGASPLLSDFAKHYGYSEAYLGKLFRKTVGVEFSGYVINARINKAKILLRSSDYTVSEIAELLGYCDACFFVKQFTKMTGTTPGRYRRS